MEPASASALPLAPSVLQAYLLGTVDFEAALALQRRLVYDIAGDPGAAALVLCEHPPLITVGRHGSWNHIRSSPDELRSRRLRIRWVNRGGGCLLHFPGQLAAYPIVPLDRLGLGLRDYLRLLQQTVLAVLDDFGVAGQERPNASGVWVGSRLVASVGVAVRDWVTYYGTVLNVHPPLEPFRLVWVGGPGEPPMTSLQRERRGPVRPSLVRQRFLEHFAARFGFGRISVFSDHPLLRRRILPDALAARA